jgi:hypothetical protein
MITLFRQNDSSFQISIPACQTRTHADEFAKLSTQPIGNSIWRDCEFEAMTIKGEFSSEFLQLSSEVFARQLFDAIRHFQTQ